MFTLRTCLVTALMVCLFGVTQRCTADEPSDRELIEELRKEVAELRRTVAELTRRLEGQEFGQLPRLETFKSQPVVRLLRTEEEVPKNFRFPINIERGTAAPVMPVRRAWRW